MANTLDNEQHYFVVFEYGQNASPAYIGGRFYVDYHTQELFEEMLARESSKEPTSEAIARNVTAEQAEQICQGTPPDVYVRIADAKSRPDGINIDTERQRLEQVNLYLLKRFGITD